MHCGMGRPKAVIQNNFFVLCFLFFNHRFGRRFVVRLSLSLLVLFGIGIAFSPNIYVFMAMKFVLGGACGVTVMNSSVLGDLICSRWQKRGDM